MQLGLRVAFVSALLGRETREFWKVQPHLERAIHALSSMASSMV